MTREEFLNLKIGDIIIHTFSKDDKRKGTIYDIEKDKLYFAGPKEHEKGIGFFVEPWYAANVIHLSREDYPEEYL